MVRLHERRTWHVSLSHKKWWPLLWVSPVGLIESLGKFQGQKCNRVQPSRIWKKDRRLVGNRFAFLRHFQGFARTPLSYFPPLNLFTAQSRSTSRFLGRLACFLQPKFFYDSSARERELASFVLPLSQDDKKRTER